MNYYSTDTFSITTKPEDVRVVTDNTQDTIQHIHTIEEPVEIQVMRDNVAEYD